MKRVIGIGGIFFKANDPEKLAAWYKKHLGFEVEDWGGVTFQEGAGADLSIGPNSGWAGLINFYAAR